MLEHIIGFPRQSALQRRNAIATLGDCSWQWFDQVSTKEDVDMDETKMQSAADEIASDFVVGQLHKLSPRFQLPVVVYLIDRIMVLRNEDQLLYAICLYRSVLSDEWLSAITSKVTNFTSERDGSWKTSVENHYFATDGRDLGTAKINYYGKASGTIRKVRMVEYLEWPCPERIAEYQPLQRMLA